MRHILTFTSLYPNAEQPNHGVFVEERLRKLRDRHGVDITVVAPVPWFPFKNRRFGIYARYARVPFREQRHGIEVYHPRYPVIPKVGMVMAPFLMAAWTYPLLSRLRRELNPCVLDAHYFYPDGVAAAFLSHVLSLPFTVTARGTDLNLIPSYTIPRRLISFSARRAAHVIAVCRALADAVHEVAGMDIPVTVLRNGVDLERFSPGDRWMGRRRYGLPDEATLLLSVGLLIERKGHDVVIRALKDLPGVYLVIAGEGELRGFLEKLASDVGVADRVRFLGPVPHDDMPELFRAADVTVLASSREGWANVILESMACGTPVVATRIWGTPEIIRDDSVGRLVEKREPKAFAAAIMELIDKGVDRDSVRTYAENFDWWATVDGLHGVFCNICGG